MFFLLFGCQRSGQTLDNGAATSPAYILISMAVYGAMIATTSGGAMVAIERALGWWRQLRLTPLHPVAYIGDQGRSSRWCSALLAVLVAFAVGAASGVAAADPRLGRVPA